jgi:hypothetical protein
MYSPRQLFLTPGLILIAVGLVGYVVGLSNLHVSNTTFGAHTLLFASLAVLCGYQAIWFAIFTKVFAINEKLMPTDSRLDRFFSVATLERGIGLGMTSLIVGIALLLVTVHQWYAVNFGNLDYGRTLRWVIPGMVLVFLGFQTVLSSFFVSILGMKRKSN